MTEPDQWARELLDAVFDASDLGSACGIVDCPQCANAAISIQRAFEEREWKLREAATTQPSGDVVEAVALAILNSDRGMRGLDPLESRENVPDSDGYVTNATAAITTYEAVSGVAKMRDALREARSGLCAFTGGPDGACSETIARIDAALGEKP